METMNAVSFWPVALLLASGFATPVPSLDLTTYVPTHKFHEPTATSVEGGATFGTDGAVVLRELPIRLVLLSVSGNFRDGIVFEVNIENQGLSPLSVPWDPNIADIEPDKTGENYKYFSANISLRFANDKHEIEASLASVLYGGTKKASTVLTLNPGESARVRMKVPKADSSSFLSKCITQGKACKISTVAVLEFAESSVTYEMAHTRRRCVRRARLYLKT